jgi:hypothetical protein
MNDVPRPLRDALFISHANPENNAFTVWLGAKLATLGYDVWADVLRLRGGQDWQRRLERAIRERAVKVLLVGTPAAVDKQGVRNEIQIAHDTGKAIRDTEFIIPLRLEPFDAPFLVAHAQYVDFSRSWSQGLSELLDTLEMTYRVPRIGQRDDARWRDVQTIHARRLSSKRESLTSNWLPISSLPRSIFHYRFNSGLSQEDIDFKLKTCRYPLVPFGAGCLSCASLADLSGHFGAGAVTVTGERRLDRFVDEGWRKRDIDRRTALSHFSDLGRRAFERFLHDRGLNGYALANGQFAWWAPAGVAPASKVAFKWPGVSGSRQICGISVKRRMHWHFGVTPNVRIGPVRHVRFTSRLVFTEDGAKPFEDPKRMHRLRRSFAKSWRNPRWRGMLLAFLAWLSRDSQELAVPMGPESWIIVRLPPIQFEAPVGIPIEADTLDDDDDAEEQETEDDFDDEEDAEDEGNE